MFVVAYLPILERRPALYFLYGPRLCLSPLIAFWTSRLACAIAAEGTEVESAPVGSGSASSGLKKGNKDISPTRARIAYRVSVDLIIR